MRKSLCVYLMIILPAIIFGANTHDNTRNQRNKKVKVHTNEEIQKAWFKVPWSNGGHYWHNRITGEDRDYLIDEL